MKYFIVILLLVLLAQLLAPFASAADCPENEICNPLNSKTLEELVVTIIAWLRNVGVAVAVLMVVVGGLQIMTAGSKSEQVATGRKTITYALVGLLILLIAQGLVSLVKSIIGA